jgi:transposase
MNQANPDPVRCLGVGIDTARYGHHVSFLRDDKRPALPALTITESHSGYQRLQQGLDRLRRRYPDVPIYVRIDAAGQYAYNLETFLRSLNLPLSVSVGEPKRNKDYRQAHFPKRKADPVESLAMARYAAVERPESSHATPQEFAALRRVTSRLQAQVKHTTRLTNQLHETLSATFPELATLVYDIAARWVLLLLKKYPTPARIAAARRNSLTAIPYLEQEMAQRIQEAARNSVGILSGDVAEQLVRQLAEALLDSLAAENAWKELLEQGFNALPEGNHRQIETILGIGKLTAAAIVATAIDIDWFATEDDFVGYYGVFPEEFSSGVDKFGRPLPAGKKRMCRKGNDLVRGLLWNCAKNAAKTNPAVRALYARLRDRGVRGDVAFGYCMTRLLRLVYAIWKTGEPFDRNRYARDAARHADPQPTAKTQADDAGSADAQQKAAGLKEQSSEGKEVTAASTSIEPTEPASKPASSPAAPADSEWIDFAAIREQVTMEQVLKHFGLLDRLRRSGANPAQFRGPCPLHTPNGQRRPTFSVNLHLQAFQCFHADCQAHGNVLDLWAALRGLSLRDAGKEIVATFHLPPATPPNREEEPVKEPVRKSDKATRTKPPQLPPKQRPKTPKRNRKNSGGITPAPP